jgi:hypothetical protein
VTYHTYFLSSLYVRKEMWKARYINNKSQNWWKFGFFF